MSADDLKTALNVIKKVLRLSETAAHFTKTEVDDKVIAKVEQLLEFAEPFIEDGSLFEIIDLITSLFSKVGRDELVAKLKDLVS